VRVAEFVALHSDAFGRSDGLGRNLHIRA